MKKLIICLDMDGTMADLYGVKDWLPQLRAESPAPYLNAPIMWDNEKLIEVLNAHREAGNEIHIITWLAKNSTSYYKEVVREAKKEWLAEHMIPFDHFHGVAYGATKADSIRKLLDDNTEAILFDDDERVRKGWHVGRAFDPTENLIAELMGLLE